MGITGTKNLTFDQRIDIQVLRPLIPQQRVSGYALIHNFTTCYSNYYARIFADYSAGADSVDWKCHVEFFQQSVQQRFQSQDFLESQILFQELNGAVVQVQNYFLKFTL